MDNITYNNLTQLSVDVGRNSNGNILGLWECFCGQSFKCANTRIRNGYTNSCGCLTELARKNNTTHGMKYSSEYSSWAAAKDRCNNPNSKDFVRYGGAGILFDSEWASSFELFLSHLGKKPKGYSLDRIDNTKGYVPGNVRWADNSQQQRNTKASKIWYIKGLVFQTAQEAAEYFNVTKQTVWKWVNGNYDKRRGSFTKPRGDCYADRRY